MHLFNASSLFDENAKNEVLGLLHAPDQLRARVIGAKELLLQLYKFEAYRLPSDFTTTSYIIAPNHLTDSDAPLLMSYHYQVMHRAIDSYPQLFVFAKENCFNGVSIPRELIPLLKAEMVFPVDRTSISGSMAAIRAAKKWYGDGAVARHFLIFPQGTIFDVNREQAADIESGAFWLASYLGIPVLPAFLEQAVEGESTRMVFGEPIVVPEDCRAFDPYKQLWIDRVIAAQNDLEALSGHAPRPAELDAEHQTRKRFKRV